MTRPDALLPTDLAQPLHLPKVKKLLAERILEEAEVARLIALEPSPAGATMPRSGCSTWPA